MRAKDAAVLSAICLPLAACSSLPRSASKSGFDFGSIRFVEVQAKAEISPLVSRELLLLGIQPVSDSKRSHGPETLLKVALARSNPERRYIVRTGKRTLAQQTSSSKDGENSSSAVVFEEDTGQQPLEVSGSGLAYTQAVFGAGDSRLVATYAQATLAAEIISGKSGEVLWAGSYSYEGVDMDSALEGAARGLVREMPFATAGR